MKRILTGDRPTGKLHLGHYVGSLKNRLRLQDEYISPQERKYEVYLLVADLHALTTNTDTSQLKQNTKDLVLDQLSVGIDPKKVIFCVQSAIPEAQELAVIFSMLVQKPRLERIPTLKDMLRDLKIESPSLGLLSYPVLQTADILMVKADLVPVGKDQASHIELTREIVERFNLTYRSVFQLPEALIPKDLGTLPGIDGKAKMSKSLGNAIFLSDSEKEVEQKVAKMYTDPTRIHPTDPGHVEENPVFIYLDAFGSTSSPQVRKKVEDYKKQYREGKVGDVEVKQFLVEVLNKFLDPIRKKRALLDKESRLVEKILEEGTEQARSEAKQTLKQVKEAMKLG
ncbi:MAG: tryptophan--tRNA ligase [Candidatus Woykebacteria bacterium RBG_16_43_9]|uniref:Tryptophan--tRNA ligase n=1 Tax=Candidatus Woykebacteria bacterium RBG_16_43_9 TaxID=1802596 RepID=A0A1G1WDW3_9BACT|nr:MAG: tryptophan--tRNA ligase [Candidatus Woykebacteria bacterium RBG_16_43_9]